MPQELPDLTPERLAAISRIRDRTPEALLGPWTAPVYHPPAEPRPGRAFFAVECFRRHMTDEAWQLQMGLQAAGYTLYGRGFPLEPVRGRPGDETDVAAVCHRENPGAAIVQDTREWDPLKGSAYDKRAGFTNIDHGGPGQAARHLPPDRL